MQLAFTSLLTFKPMLVPPRPWESSRVGGHLMLNCRVVRTFGHMDTTHLLQASDRVAASGMGAGMTKAKCSRCHTASLMPCHCCAS